MEARATQTDKQLIVVDASETILSNMKESIQGAVTTYVGQRYFWQFDSDEMKKLKKLAKTLTDSGTLQKEDMFELFHLIKQYQLTKATQKQPFLEKIKDVFHGYPLLEKLDNDNLLTLEYAYIIATHVDASNSQPLLHLFDNLTVSNDNKLTILLTIIEYNSPCTSHYANAAIAIFSKLNDVHSLTRESITACVLSLNKTNDMCEHYVRALRNLLAELTKHQIMTLDNALACMNTLALGENEELRNSFTSSLYCLKSTYYQNIDVALSNLTYFLKKIDGLGNLQQYFETIFNHPTPHLYTDILPWLIERHLDTESNLEKLLIINDPGALFVLNICCGYLTQQDLNTFIQCKNVFADKEIVAALRFVHPGLFASFTPTIIGFCDSTNSQHIKQSILELIAENNHSYATSKAYRFCAQNNFQLAGPVQWKTVDDYAILGIPNNATHSEMKEAYSRLAKKYHPDKNPNDKEANNKFQEVLGAYRRLSALSNKQVISKETVTAKYL